MAESKQLFVGLLLLLCLSFSFANRVLSENHDNVKQQDNVEKKGEKCGPGGGGGGRGGGNGDCCGGGGGGGNGNCGGNCCGNPGGNWGGNCGGNCVPGGGWGGNNCVYGYLCPSEGYGSGGNGGCPPYSFYPANGNGGSPMGIDMGQKDGADKTPTQIVANYEPSREPRPPLTGDDEHTDAHKKHDQEVHA